MPSLSNYNRFNVLAIHESNEIVEPIAKAVQNPDTPSNPLPTATYFRDNRPKLERRLLFKFVVAATEESPTSLKLKVELETADTAEVKSVNSLVDCGATGGL